MEEVVKVSPLGLWRSPAAVETPQGALETAEDVVIRRQGLADPRPGFSSAVTFNPAQVEPVRLVGFDTDYFGATENGPSRWAGAGTDIKRSGVTRTDPADITWEGGYIAGQEARGNLYLTTDDVVRKLEAMADVTASACMAPTAFLKLPASPADGTTQDDDLGWLADGDLVAYRVVIAFEDSNGVVVRSAPSNLITIRNDEGGVAYPTVYVMTHEEGRGFHRAFFVELYRSLATPETPEDELFLAQRVACDANTANVTITDQCPEEALGVSLYTNESQEGATAAHLPPFQAKCATWFNGSLILANLQFPAGLNLRIGDLARSFAIGGGLVFTVNGVVFDGTVASGSPTITAIADTSAIEVGMILSNLSVLGGADHYVTGTSGVVLRVISKTSNSITLNVNSDQTAVGRKFYAVHALHVEGPSTTTQYYPMNGVAGLVALVRADGTALGQSFNASPDMTADMVDDRTVVLRALYPGELGEDFEVSATGGGSYSPELPVPGATARGFDQDVLPNGIAWSNAREPEHFQLANVDEVGPGGHLQALITLKNAVILFGSQGVYRLSGAGATSGFRIDELAHDVRLLQPSAACRLVDHVYAWSDKGVVRGDENGLVDISTAPLFTDLRLLQEGLAADPDDGHLGAWMVPNRKNNEVLLSVPSSGDTSIGAGLYVFSALGGWVKWMSGQNTQHGLYGSDGMLRILQGDGVIRTERSPASSTYTADVEHSVNVSAASGLSVTIDGGSGWTPEVGDAIRRGGVLRAVTAVTDATHFTTDAALGSTGASTAYEAFTSEIAFIATTERHPGELKQWGEGSVWWENVNGLLTYEHTFENPLDAETYTRTIAETLTELGPIAESFRFVTPRNVGRGTRLVLGVSVTQATALWALSGMSVSARLMSKRVRRR